MSRVYECIQWNPTTQTCDAAAWVERASLVAALPTPEQAQVVGLAVFASIAIIGCMSLLFPPRSYSDD